MKMIRKKLIRSEICKVGGNRDNKEKSPVDNPKNVKTNEIDNIIP